MPAIALAEPFRPQPTSTVLPIRRVPAHIARDSIRHCAFRTPLRAGRGCDEDPVGPVYIRAIAPTVAEPAFPEPHVSAFFIVHMVGPF